MDELRNELWNLLWADVKAEDEFPARRPLLAHYTSAQTLDAIFSSGQFWLSHPMLMNDMEELQWGIRAGVSVLQAHNGISSALGSSGSFDLLRRFFDEYVEAMGSGDAYSIFAACFCEHNEESDVDGLLSMWRAYGANGGGAAIVFDTSKLTPKDESPFLLAPIRYGTGAEREAWISGKLDEVAKFIGLNKAHVNNDFLSTIAHLLLARLKIFALTTKHSGFKEEREWRLIYLPDRDHDSSFSKNISYVVGSKGFHPKMKLPLNSDLLGEVELSGLIKEVILGPTHEGALGLAAVRHMLSSRGYDELTPRVFRSTTPFRPA